MILLTDEELDNVGFDMGSPFGLTDRYTVCRAVMKAQLKKVVELLKPHMIERPNTGKVRIIFDYEDWQALLKEIK